MLLILKLNTNHEYSLNINKLFKMCIKYCFDFQEKRKDQHISKRAKEGLRIMGTLFLDGVLSAG